MSRTTKPARFAPAFTGLALVLAACGPSALQNPPLKPPVAEPPPVATTPPPILDALGPKPEAPAPAPFAPPAPVVYTTPGGLTVWLVERHSLPLVSMTLAVSSGAASDPKGKQGLAWATANMLDEGAGKLGSIALAKEIETLGASIHTGASLDYAHASLTVVKKNLAPAFALFGDVVARPRFDAAEWKRVRELWQNDLSQRSREPQAVAQIVAMRALYGEGPYGHPVDGVLASAKAASLADVRAFYKGAWRPDAATLVVVGDVTRAELDPLLAAALGAWKATGPKPAVLTPPPPAAPAPRSTAWPRVLLVDRADAPQSVIAFVRTGKSAADPDAPVQSRVNIALGGSFTSRLNQDLREEHGWSYGAGSRVTLLRGTGSVVASAAVQTDHTGDALGALVKDIEELARTGLTDDEVQKTRLVARGELVDMFEQAESAAMRLARDAALGLGPDYEAKASARRDTAPREDLARMAKEFEPKDGYVVVVGPRAKLEKQLTAIGVDSFDVRDAEGKPLK